MNAPVANSLQVLRFSTDSYQPHERVAAWREVYGRTVVSVDITPRSGEAFHARAEIMRCAGLGLIHASTSAAHHAVARDAIAGDGVSFMAGVTCSWRASQRGRETELAPGDGVLMSNSDLGTITLPSECRYVTFSLPRSVFASQIIDIEAGFARRVPATSPALQMLVRYLDLARSRQVLITPELATAYTSHVGDLLVLALGTGGEGAALARGRGRQAARLDAMKEDVRRNLGQPDLSVHAVATRHGISVRCAQKLFEESGCTFGRFLTEERLAAAHDALGSRADTPISAIAYHFGFGDLSNFNRAFRRRFGCTPSDVRKAAAPAAADTLR